MKRHNCPMAQCVFRPMPRFAGQSTLRESGLFNHLFRVFCIFNLGNLTETLYDNNNFKVINTVCSFITCAGMIPN